MTGMFFTLLKKDFRLMLSARFFLLAAGSLVLYSCYIHFVYVSLDDKMYPVYCYDPAGIGTQAIDSITAQDSGRTLPPVKNVNTKEELADACSDGYSIGIDLSEKTPRIRMVSCGIDTIDHLRAAYAASRISAIGAGGAAPLRNALLDSEGSPAKADQAAPSSTGAALIGKDSKEMKNRREITAEFLFFELAAVGFLGLAAMLFKEKDMGVIRIHAVIPVQRNAFILSKLGLILLSDLVFSTMLTLINLGAAEGLAVLPAVLMQAGILSLLMALAGFFCAIALPDFKQFSLLYLVLAVFITTPVFLAGQTGLEIGWIKYHPMYHLFLAMKNAYFRNPNTSPVYYAACVCAVALLYLLAGWGLRCEMKREG